MPASFADSAELTLNEAQRTVATLTLEQANAQASAVQNSIPSGVAIQESSPLSVSKDSTVNDGPKDFNQTIEVQEGESIQTAINQAHAGDQVLVHVGTYHEHVVLKQGVTLSGEDAAATIIHGDYVQGVPVIRALGDNLISNLTITGARDGGGPVGGAVRIEGEHVKIRDNKIQFNLSAGVYVYADVDYVLIERNLFYGNLTAIEKPRQTNEIRYNTITGYDTAPMPRISSIRYLPGRGFELGMVYSKDIYSYRIQYTDNGGLTWRTAQVQVSPGVYQDQIVLANPSGITSWIDDGTTTSPNPLGVQMRWYRAVVAESFVSNTGIKVFNEGQFNAHGNIITNQRSQSVWEEVPGLVLLDRNIFYHNAEVDTAHLPNRIFPPSGQGWQYGNILANPQFIDPSNGNYSVPQTSRAYGRGAYIPEILKFAFARADSVLERTGVGYTMEEIRSGQLLNGWRFLYGEGVIETFYKNGTGQWDTTPPAIVFLSTTTLTDQASYELRYTIDGVEYAETRNLVEGVNTLTVEASDIFLNTATRSLSVTLDTLPPVVVVDPKTPHFLVTTSLTISYTSDGVAKQKTFTGLAEGANTLTITETDLLGHQTIVSWDVTVNTSLAPFTWIYNGVGAGLWSVGANWWGGVAPGALDAVFFGPYAVSDCVIDTAVSVAHMTIFSNYTSTITQQANVHVSGDFSQAGGHWVDANPTSHTFAVDGSFSIPETAGAFNRYGAQVSDAYQVRDVYDLQAMSGFLSSNFRLAGNVDASSTANWNSGAGFNPIGNYETADHPEYVFSGTFDGFGHTVSSLRINRSAEDYVGLFGRVKNSSISNIGLLDVNIIGKSSVGGLAGSNSGSTITNAYTTGTVMGTSSVGGLSGSGGSISNSYSTAAVTGSGSRVGGLVGSGGSITGSHATGAVRGNGYTGGLLGYSLGASINSSYATGTVTGTSSYTGGLVGYNRGGSVSKSYASGVVTGSRYVGGLVGFNYSYAHITDSYATGSVSGTSLGDTDVGGLAGANEYYSTILNSYSTGAVTGYKRAGGLTGFNWDHATITNSFTTSSVTGTEEVGGLTGCQYCTGSESNSYFTDNHRNGKGIYEPLGASAFYGFTHAVYAQGSGNAWDFMNVWDAFANTFPHLQSENFTPSAQQRFNAALNSLGGTPFAAAQPRVASTQGEDLDEAIKTASGVMNKIVEMIMSKAGKKQQNIVRFQKPWNENRNQLKAALQEAKMSGDYQSSMLLFEQRTILFKEICAKILL